MSRLFAIPVELTEANRFVNALHRHHDATVTHRFSIGAVDPDGVLRGVAICNRPVARALSSRDILEVARLCTDGSPHVCSFLYAASARAAKAIGYKRVQTYILDSETGVSLAAAGWRFDGLTSTAHTWNNRPGRDEPDHLRHGARGRWVRDLDDRPPLRSMPDKMQAEADPLLDLDFGGVA